MNPQIKRIIYKLASDGMPGIPGAIVFYPHENRWMTSWRGWGHDTEIFPDEELRLINSRIVEYYRDCQHCFDAPADSGDDRLCASCAQEDYEYTVRQEYHSAIGY